MATWPYVPALSWRKEATITASASTNGRAMPERMVFSHPQNEAPHDRPDRSADAKPSRDALFSDHTERRDQSLRTA